MTQKHGFIHFTDRYMPSPRPGTGFTLRLGGWRGAGILWWEEQGRACLEGWGWSGGPPNRVAATLRLQGWKGAAIPGPEEMPPDIQKPQGGKEPLGKGLCRWGRVYKRMAPDKVEEWAAATLSQSYSINKATGAKTYLYSMPALFQALPMY